MPLSIEEIFRKEAEVYKDICGYTIDITPFVRIFLSFVDSEIDLFNSSSKVYSDEYVERFASDCSFRLAQNDIEKDQYMDLFLYFWDVWNRKAFAVY